VQRHVHARAAQLLALAWRHPVPGVCGNALFGRLEGPSAVGAVRGRVGNPVWALHCSAGQAGTAAERGASGGLGGAQGGMQGLQVTAQQVGVVGWRRAVFCVHWQGVTAVL
jgi:hypothetical protein